MKYSGKVNVAISVLFLSNNTVLERPVLWILKPKSLSVFKPVRSVELLIKDYGNIGDTRPCHNMLYSVFIKDFPKHTKNI